MVTVSAVIVLFVPLEALPVVATEEPDTDDPPEAVKLTEPSVVVEYDPVEPVSEGVCGGLCPREDEE